MKKFVVFTLLVVLVCVAGVFVVRKNKSPPSVPLASPSPAASLPPSALPSVSFPRLEVAPTEVIYSVGALPSSVPSSVSLYEVLPIGSFGDVAQGLAGSFGFSGSPQQTAMDSAVAFLWDNGEQSFSFLTDPLSFGYYRRTLGTSPLIQTDGEYKDAAIAFIKKTVGLFVGGSLSSPVISYLAPKNNDPIQTTRNKATVVRLEFRLFVDGLPLLSGYPDIPTYVLWMDGTGSVVRLVGAYFPGVRYSGSSVSLVGVTGATNRLLSGGGSLLSVYSVADRNKVETQYYFFNSVSITSVGVSYYYGAGSASFVPVYEFRGTAQDKDTKRRIEIISLVPALP